MDDWCSKKIFPCQRKEYFSKELDNSFPLILHCLYADKGEKVMGERGRVLLGRAAAPSPLVPLQDRSLHNLAGGLEVGFFSQKGGKVCVGYFG